MKTPLLLLLLALPVTAQAQNPFGNRGLFLKKGTITVGGSLSLEVVHYSPEGGESQQGTLTTLSPKLGYFLSENVSLELSGGVTYPGGDLANTMTTAFYLAVGALYYHKLNTIYLYGGILAAHIESEQHSGDGTNNTKHHKSTPEWYSSLPVATSQTAVILPAGVLFPITSSLAFDVGVKIIYIIDGDDNTILDFALGWFGLQAFF